MRSKYGRLARVGLVGLAAAGLAATGAPASQAWAELQTEPPRLLITEVMYEPPGRDDEGEWIELANFGAVAIDLAGYGLGDESARGGGEGMARFPAGLMLEPGGVLAVAQTAAGYRALYGTNPQAELRATDPAVPDMVADPGWASGAVGLANDGDEVLLLDPADMIVDALAYGPGAAWLTGTFTLPAAAEAQWGGEPGTAAGRLRHEHRGRLAGAGNA